MFSGIKSAIIPVIREFQGEHKNCLSFPHPIVPKSDVLFMDDRQIDTVSKDSMPLRREIDPPRSDSTMLSVESTDAEPVSTPRPT
jgi:hypothetical protein